MVRACAHVPGDFDDIEVKNGDAENSSCQLPECGVSIGTPQNMPPLEIKVREYPFDEGENSFSDWKVRLPIWRYEGRDIDYSWRRWNIESGELSGSQYIVHEECKWDFPVLQGIGEDKHVFCQVEGVDFEAFSSGVAKWIHGIISHFPVSAQGPSYLCSFVNCEE